MLQFHVTVPSYTPHMKDIPLSYPEAGCGKAGTNRAMIAACFLVFECK